jgi:hypothetical protein
MADAASTSTLVVVALSGGTGAFLGVVVNQAVQLSRDKKQYGREDARHERERQEALEDERRKRREDQYVALLTALTELDRPLEGTAHVVPEIVRYREQADGPEALGGAGDVERALADSCARACRQTWEAA